MDNEKLEQDAWACTWASEISSRYHRYRASYLKTVDTIINISQLLGASAIAVEILGNSPSIVSKISAFIIAFLAILQIVLDIGSNAAKHSHLMGEWLDLLDETELLPHTNENVQKWTRRRTFLNKSNTIELRALAIYAENIAASARGISGRQRHINHAQHFLKQIVTFQRDFPSVPDTSPPAPSDASDPK
jgi:hypothetical protein